MDSNKSDKIIDVLIILLSLLLLVYIFPRYISITEKYAMASLSPAFFPKLATWLIFGLAALHLIYSVKTQNHLERKKEVKDWLSANEERKAYVTCILIIAYLVLMKYMGFLITSVALLCLLFVMQGVKGPIKVLATSSMVTMGIYFLFYFALQIHFPAGLLFE